MPAPRFAPTFSVVIRSQGNRPNELVEAIRSVREGARRPDQLILALHDTDAARIGIELDGIDVITEHGGTRGAPLASAVQIVQSSHILFLDDDDIALPNWIDAFGRVLDGSSKRTGARARALVQTWQRGGNLEPPLPLDQPQDAYPVHLDVLAHFSVNQTPFMAVAFPTDLFRTGDIAVDLSLEVCEDWDLLLQLLCATEVREVNEATALYRRWKDEDTSYAKHSHEVWLRSEQQVRSRLAGRTLQLSERILAEVSFLNGLRHEIDGLREASIHWQNVQASRSWRLMRRIRRFLP